MTGKACRRSRSIWLITVLIVLLAGTAGCGGQPPKIQITTPAETTVQLEPGASKALAANVVEGQADKIVWTASCLKASEDECQKVLKNKEGMQNFVTAPDRPGEQIIVRAVAQYKGLKSQEATKTFEVIAGKPKCDPGGVKIAVTSHMDGQQVLFQNQFSGTITGLLSGCQLWMIIFPHVVNNYHPQVGPATVDQAGSWTNVGFIGRSPEGSIGEKFNLLAVLADPEAGQEFQAYLDKAARDKNWPGMDKLPKGATILRQVNNLVRVGPVSIAAPTATAPAKPVATTSPTDSAKPVASPTSTVTLSAGQGRSSHPVYTDGKLTAGYDMGVNTSGGRTNWVATEDQAMCMAYPAGQDWGAVFITVGKSVSPGGRTSPEHYRDLSSYRTLSFELRGKTGGEHVWVGLKDNRDPDDGSETKVAVHLLKGLTTDWQLFTIPLSNFESADPTRLYIVPEFVF